MMADKMSTKVMHKCQNKDVEIKSHNLLRHAVSPVTRKTDHIPFLLCSSKRHWCCSKSSAACCSMQNCFY